MKDGVLTTVLTVVFTALVGGTVTFIFGGIREKRKTLYERRIEAIDGVRAKARSVVEIFGRWTERAATLRSSFTYQEELLEYSSQEGLFKEIGELVDQGTQILGEMSALDGFYHAERPYLEAVTCNVVESFQKEIHDRHIQLLEALPKVRVPAKLDENAPGPSKEERKIRKRLLAIQRMQQSLAFPMPAELVEQLQTLGVFLTPEDVKGIREAAKLAREWDAQAHIDALDAEAGRLARTQPRWTYFLRS